MINFIILAKWWPQRSRTILTNFNKTVLSILHAEFFIKNFVCLSGLGMPFDEKCTLRGGRLRQNPNFYQFVFEGSPYAQMLQNTFCGDSCTFSANVLRGKNGKPQSF